MTKSFSNSSPARRQSPAWGSPGHSAEDLFFLERNSEARHRQLIETARLHAERIRQEAERVYDDYFERQRQERLLEEQRKEQRKEEERIKFQENLAAEQIKLNALKATRIEIPPPLPEPEPPAAPKTNGLATSAPTPATIDTSTGVSPFAQPKSTAVQAQKSDPAVPAANPFGVRPQVVSQTGAAAAPAVSPSAGVQVNGGSALVAPSKPAATSKTETTGPDRHVQVHKELKALRRSMADQARTNPMLKERIGDMRREIKKSVGQLSGGVPGTNKIQQQKIIGLLREALSNQVQSQLVDPSLFVLEPRSPASDAANNGELPSIFLYLLNILSKAAIQQFIREASVRPETADPVGVCIAASFSQPEFLWRGISLIDVLLAKFRVVCPVLFGYRGSEKTEQGRARLGWWKEYGHWVPEQQHTDRMRGLGAGFASISLRKFALAKKENPYPPRHYWTAMSRIVNTPAAEISDTQCVVLQSMIQNYEQKFIEFYGTAAVAALRTALVSFPAKAFNKSAAVTSLEVLAQSLGKETGLKL